MLVVSDTSPISNLIELESIDLLPQLFGKIAIPSIVEQELSQHPKKHFLVLFDQIKQADWLEVIPTENLEIPSEVLDANLDAGETHAISLALSIEADALLIDERAGYHVARNLRIQAVGILGVLIEAKR